MEKYDTSKDGELDREELTVFFQDVLKRKNLEEKYSAA
jgi:hypothetical protein